MRLVRHLLAAFLVASGGLGTAAKPAAAALISATYTVSSPNTGLLDPFTGAFAVTFDNSANATGVAAVSGLSAGFNPGQVNFIYIMGSDNLLIFGSATGASVTPAPASLVVDDFLLTIRQVSSAPSISTGLYTRSGVVGATSFQGGSLTVGSTTVPEPPSLALLATGLLSLGFASMRRNRFLPAAVWSRAG